MFGFGRKADIEKSCDYEILAFADGQ